ncbi:MAG: hypothetical protein E6575_19640 [Bradyrhizobium sp.]|nr:hypothetical protein [Bradyrhizobium sp.]
MSATSVPTTRSERSVFWVPVFFVVVLRLVSPKTATSDDADARLAAKSTQSGGV